MLFEERELSPVIVPDWPESEHERPITWPLIDGLRVLLVAHRAAGNPDAQPAVGVALHVTARMLEERGLDIDRAREVSLENLISAAQNQELTFGLTKPATDGSRAFVSFGHWLCAAAVLLPGFYGMVRGALNDEDLRASIPHRNALYIVRAADASAWEARIAEAEAGARKAITSRWLRLLPDVREPWYVRSPVAWSASS